ncbi:hypothetical protein SAMN05216494_1970 [Streptococcus sp. NLAE-zl-C503]|jgi:hypothetical protein|uniref:hypothetical protein n=1 Tax=Streptococcus sp. NLAE-zl-C503 TaxID=1855327 RepID=UPI0008880C25|nr:hypothetical protein [Streptococcus sp. NLAE-zl-C503]SDP67538.1 hypothetical protein SAMN05216494_1970 [Streptococcus sp. NLAE-zl-C503]
MRLKKTLFGNYRAKEVEDCIEALEEGFDREIQKKNEKIESLRKKIDSMKNQEKEIGEAVIYAKSLVIEAHDRAEKEAKEVLEKAQKDYLDTRESILEEIDTLTKKRAEAERLYNLQKEKIKNIISRIDDLLELDDIDGKPRDIKKIQELRKELERPEEVAKEKEEEVPEREKVHLEQPLAKTGTDSTISVSYITSRRAKPKKKDEDKLDDDKGKRIKRLSRIKRDNFL